MVSKKYVYFFGGGEADGDASMKALLGGKGANLAEMTRLKLPVPPGFTISTEMCHYYLKNNHTYPDDLRPQVDEVLARMEKIMGRRFGDPSSPMLVSVRSGAPVSMPGMMDTVLNLGLNDVIVEGLAKQTNARFAYDAYRRFLKMYGDVVLGVKAEQHEGIDPFEKAIDRLKHARGIQQDTEMSTDDLKQLCVEFRSIIRTRTGQDIPDDPRAQLRQAAGAVFGSWNNPRAVSYRQLNRIAHDLGTAVNIQAMVYGNMNDDCATGVAFTRDSSLGDNALHGEFLNNAQGEDVVAGTRTPMPLSKHQKAEGDTVLSLEEMQPALYAELLRIRDVLEKHYRDMQDIEFTIQDGQLWMLQTRTGKRTGIAAARIAVEMVEEGLITPQEAILRIDPERHLQQLLQPIFDPSEKKKAETSGRLLARGLAAGPGAASGMIVFSAEEAEEMAKHGHDILLVRTETSPEDIRGMAVSKGILTARGGATSHAALVARQMGKVCVSGCQALDLDYSAKQLRIKDRILKQGDWLSLDGFEGKVYDGKIKTKASEVVQVLLEKSLRPEDAPLYRLYEKLMRWASEARRLEVWTNADQPDQAVAAVAFGAQGIGLCRTEHMFFEGDRIDSVREMILATDRAGREAALAKLAPLQEEDFVGLFRALGERKVTIRLLDPPLHEFLPHEPKQVAELAEKIGCRAERLKQLVDALHESNPMLGHRGCRLLLTYPEIAEMQVAAVMRAACRIAKEGVKVLPAIMIPLVGIEEELASLRVLTCRVADQILQDEGLSIKYSVGTMIELPRACMVADAIARHADFFSFGTNDLTQTTYGFSRDDIGKFLPAYIEQRLLTDDPFQTLDTKGVGGLMKIALEKGRSTRPDLHLGICGEHGGDPRSVQFCHNLGLHYVSCSPYRVPIALMAAGQAALQKAQQP